MGRTLLSVWFAIMVALSAGMLAKHLIAFPGPRMPIIMLTAEVQPKLLQRAKRAGAKGWIVKPFKPELFAATVRKMVGDA